MSVDAGCAREPSSSPSSPSLRGNTNRSNRLVPYARLDAGSRACATAGSCLWSPARMIRFTWLARLISGISVAASEDCAASSTTTASNLYSFKYSAPAALVVVATTRARSRIVRRSRCSSNARAVDPSRRLFRLSIALSTSVSSAYFDTRVLIWSKGPTRISSPSVMPRSVPSPSSDLMRPRARRSTSSSTAALLGAHNSTRGAGEHRSSAEMAPTSVDVFPVPGGP
mmetsp:Transcript_2488/g.10390  ORF Transcript_2488/g.10390 Transcript_2488/m.10390 type:complete len:227 (-) Transcript_2488:2260-2940(-)